MRFSRRIIASVGLALVVGLALMAQDRARDAGWAVTPAQVADARAAGKLGVELAPGAFTAEPVPAEGAWLLPVKWMLTGLAAGLAVLAATGLHRPPAGGSRDSARDRRRVPPDHRL